jgi:hypothetical protein
MLQLRMGAALCCCCCRHSTPARQLLGRYEMKWMVTLNTAAAAVSSAWCASNCRLWQALDAVAVL